MGSAEKKVKQVGERSGTLGVLTMTVIGVSIIMTIVMLLLWLFAS